LCETATATALATETTFVTATGPLEYQRQLHSRLKPHLQLRAKKADAAFDRVSSTTTITTTTTTTPTTTTTLAISSVDGQLDIIHWTKRAVRRNKFSIYLFSNFRQFSFQMAFFICEIDTLKQNIIFTFESFPGKKHSAFLS